MFKDTPTRTLEKPGLKPLPNTKVDLLPAALSVLTAKTTLAFKHELNDSRM